MIIEFGGLVLLLFITFYLVFFIFFKILPHRGNNLIPNFVNAIIAIFIFYLKELKKANKIRKKSRKFKEEIIKLLNTSNYIPKIQDFNYEELMECCRKKDKLTSNCLRKFNEFYGILKGFQKEITLWEELLHGNFSEYESLYELRDTLVEVKDILSFIGSSDNICANLNHYGKLLELILQLRKKL